MIYHDLLRDGYSHKEAKKLQKKYREKIQEEKSKQGFYIKEKDIRYIMGVDVSYCQKNQQDLGIACAILWSYEKNNLLKKHFSQSIIKFPYKAGFLGFRENNLIYNAIKNSKIRPDVIMSDGHGIIHPLRFGEATHLGFALQIPSFGIAKNQFIGFGNWDELKRFKGNKTPVWSKDPDKSPSDTKEKIGYAVCLSEKRKPVFVSSGYKINLDLALNISLKTTFEHRQPEPLYLADKFSRERIKNL